MIQLASNDSCTGCSACKAVCPYDAIEIRADRNGFFLPLVHPARCRECHLCERTCPALNPGQIAETPFCFAARCRDTNILDNSSSGGIFSTLADRILSEEGCVFGCAFEGPERVIHIKAENESDLSAMRGSKYLQSDLGDSFHSVRKELNKGRKILFSGCPCQIAGLKHFLGDNNANLITMEVICHGVPAPEVWRQYLGWLKKEKGFNKVLNVNFRDKSISWNRSRFLLTAESSFPRPGGISMEICEDIWSNPFMMSFLHNLCLRPSCYRCSARQGRSGADITVGDFWGVETVLPDFDEHDKGVSAVMLHSDLGKRLWENCRDEFRIHPVSYQEIVVGNCAYISSPSIPKKSAYFMRKYHSGKDFSALVNKCVRSPWPLRVISRGLAVIRRILHFSGKN